MDPRFEDRLAWNGSKGTDDLQDGSIYILNVTYNDTGTYTCNFTRTLTYNYYEVQANNTKTVQLNVVPRRKAASVTHSRHAHISDSSRETRSPCLSGSCLRGRGFLICRQMWSGVWF